MLISNSEYILYSLLLHSVTLVYIYDATSYVLEHRRGRDEKRHSKTVSEETFQSGEPQQQEKGNEGEERDSLGEEEEEEEEEEDEEVEGEESEEESDGSEEMDGGDVEAKVFT